MRAKRFFRSYLKNRNPDELSRRRQRGIAMNDDYPFRGKPRGELFGPDNAADGKQRWPQQEAFGNIP